MIGQIELILLGFMAFGLSGLLTIPIRNFAISRNITDKPNLARKSQLEPVPYLGGLSIALSVSILTFSAVIYSDNTQTTIFLALALLVPALFLGFIGLVDDIVGLDPLPRLFIQTVMAVVVSVFLIRSNTVGISFDKTFLDEALMIFWIIGICNSINFFDNHDGGAAGTVAISTIGISLIAWGENQELIASFALVTAGSTLGFLIWNKSPAKIYMGDAGALFLGVLVAVLTIRLNPGISTQINSIAILPMLLALPILDTRMVVFSRIRRGISPFTGGKDHLSHRLMRKGISKQNTAFCLWGMQASFVAIALVVYFFSETLGTPGVVLAGAYWLGAFVWFWRIPSSD